MTMPAVSRKLAPAAALITLLEMACPDDLVVFPNVNMRLGAASALEPDVVIARPPDVTGARLVRVPGEFSTSLGGGSSTAKFA
jgi:hypothetical protein